MQKGVEYVPCIRGILHSKQSFCFRLLAAKLEIGFLSLAMYALIISYTLKLVRKHPI